MYNKIQITPQETKLKLIFNHSSFRLIFYFLLKRKVSSFIWTFKFVTLMDIFHYFLTFDAL